MAKLNNEQARRKVEEDYNGRWNEGMLFDLMDMEKIDVSWEFYDEQYNKPCLILDDEGRVVGKIEH